MKAKAMFRHGDEKVFDHAEGIDYLAHELLRLKINNPYRDKVSYVWLPTWSLCYLEFPYQGEEEGK